MRRLILMTAALSLTAGAAEKQIYAHYMGCWPPRSVIRHLETTDHRDLRPDNANLTHSSGGRFRNIPLFPPEKDFTLEQNAEIEIRRAMRGGLDGFAFDAWAGGEFAKRYLSVMFAYCEKNRLPFKLTICLDPSCHKNTAGDRTGEFVKTIKWLVDTHGKSPNLARRDGKVLIFGYGSAGIRDTDAYRKLKTTAEKDEFVRAAYREVEKAVGTPIFWHYDMDNGPKTVEHAAFLGKNYQAVGGFVGENNRRWRFRKDLISAIKAGGAEWSQPLTFQYWNKAMGPLCGNGLDILFENWQAARESGSTLIQFVTWNDYGEETQLAPNTSQNYSVLDINKYLIDWWKQGKAPAVGRDALHVIFRRHPAHANVFPFHARFRDSNPTVLEVVSLLTRPGKIEVPRCGTYDAPAGLFRKQFPLPLGTIAAELKRDGKTALKVEAPERVTDKPFRTDWTVVAFSSDFDAAWKSDFPADPPFYFSEYGDRDGDGLPNWFEMLYFGKFPVWSTATAAKPGDDPDGDGKTNLEEYLAQTDPRKAANLQYPSSYKWNFDGVFKRRLSNNPDADENGNPVWFYFYREGAEWKIPRDGQYKFCNSQLHNRGRDMMQLTPYTHPKYPNMHGWLRRIPGKNGKTVTEFRSARNASLILGWRAPVAGTVELKFKLDVGKGWSPVRLAVMHNDQTLTEKTFDAKGASENFRFENRAVRPGDFLYLIFDRRNGSGIPVLEDMEITLK